MFIVYDIFNLFAVVKCYRIRMQKLIEFLAYKCMRHELWVDMWQPLIMMDIKMDNSSSTNLKLL